MWIEPMKLKLFKPVVCFRVEQRNWSNSLGTFLSKYLKTCHNYSIMPLMATMQAMDICLAIYNLPLSLCFCHCVFLVDKKPVAHLQWKEKRLDKTCMKRYLKSFLCRLSIITTKHMGLAQIIRPISNIYSEYRSTISITGRANGDYEPVHLGRFYSR